MRARPLKVAFDHRIIINDEMGETINDHAVINDHSNAIANGCKRIKIMRDDNKSYAEIAVKVLNKKIKGIGGHGVEAGCRFTLAPVCETDF